MQIHGGSHCINKRPQISGDSRKGLDIGILRLVPMMTGETLSIKLDSSVETVLEQITTKYPKVQDNNMVPYGCHRAVGQITIKTQ